MTMKYFIISLHLKQKQKKDNINLIKRKATTIVYKIVHKKIAQGERYFPILQSKQKEKASYILY